MNKLLLIGPGNIGLDYVKVLQSIDIQFEVIGRSPKNDWIVPVYEHGIKKYLENLTEDIDFAIVSTNENQLCEVTLELISYGVKNILIEKPGSLFRNELVKLKKLAEYKNIKLFIGYNRRFYQSVKKCKEKIYKCDDLISGSFSFTIIPSMIDFDKYSLKELERLFLYESTHVIDTIFYLLGKPKELNCYTKGKLDWHSSAAIFQGSGVTERGALINYESNWISAGRWWIEISLPNEKLILKPLEKLHYQFRDSFEKKEYLLKDEKIDIDFKPGLYHQVSSFLSHQQDLCTIDEQIDNFSFYYKIANYK